ncbi:hypothetical protein [aff. Roholtiella sp. LEGE 12411]|uniref:hypothetical protein n=1 Tax=aff. Roholtiella sp. LEGE 12411 TaxID=1828822 RepID=UPI001880483A|nr:hypothetical protein [aff. Roholtiella sp. LEGE 12411]MBE9034329.1 hypothetical protein [aff. Roholtiella sp. LEGE 12411]
MNQRCDRNRKRSKRRAILCPVHGCCLDSVSQKYRLYADTVGQLQQRGINRRKSLILLTTQTAVPLVGEWLEAFWCDQCQQTKWYHIKKAQQGAFHSSQAQIYEVSLAPTEVWQQATGVIHPQGNPSVGEFTKRHARMSDHPNIKDFQFQI